MPTCKKCGGDFPWYSIVDGKKRSFTKRKYCLDCSPFGGHNTRQLHIEFNGKFCLKCGGSLKGRQIKYCSKECRDRFLVRERQSRMKRVAVKYKGGKCQICGYNRCLSSLVFHHLDSSKKEFSLSASFLAKYSWNRVKEELDKCVLLCANCHGEVHQGLIGYQKT